MQHKIDRSGNPYTCFRDEIDINPLQHMIETIKYNVSQGNKRAVVTCAWETGRMMREGRITPHGIDEKMMEMCLALYLKYHNIKEAWRYNKVKDALNAI